MIQVIVPHVISGLVKMLPTTKLTFTGLGAAPAAGALHSSGALPAGLASPT